jgi:hypothetical protein
MMRSRMGGALVAAIATVGLLAPAAESGTTHSFTFHSHGTAVVPGAAGGVGTPGSYEDFPFTIHHADRNGTVSIAVNWSNPADDWDLYVYRRTSGGTLDTVGSSTGAPPDTQEQAVLQASGGPVRSGNYVVRVQNYASTSPDFTGFVKFGAYIPPNRPPKAVLRAPRRATAGRRVTLDASRSRDPDGRIVNYAWDLNGDGAMEVNAHRNRRLVRSFRSGVHQITLRVTDSRGARAYANARIVVSHSRR